MMDLCPVCGVGILSAEGRCLMYGEEQREKHKIAALESIAASLVKLANPMVTVPADQPVDL